ncbi:DALR anticodon-binding domain-containing protein [Myxacorys almedinensis]|uniref:DALR anticodon binding domain-containing protein n=1 Tax=Myxacorys almedinensis A TaxID=2690445 RepID=A0A8J7Z824_9CYAN|nr:hypothetical protein [Myxacorys almedinensis A]
MKIHEAICLWEDVLQARCPTRFICGGSTLLDSRLSTFGSIVKRVPSKTSFSTYRSAIALKLGARSNNLGLEIAEQLAGLLGRKDTIIPEMDDLAESVLRDLTVTVISPGILEFNFSDRAIAVWLQCLIAMPPNEEHYTFPEATVRHPELTLSSSDLFFCQFAYARCCSLLRLATQTKVDALDSIAWLSDHQRLLLQDLAERELIAQAIAVTDGLSEGSDPLKMALSLSQAFATFERSCRIFGDRAQTNRHLSHCRLGLVMITQRLLRSLLQQELGIYAPSEL